MESERESERGIGSIVTKSEREKGLFGTCWMNFTNACIFALLLKKEEALVNVKKV